jgi:hypothetical protein
MTMQPVQAVQVQPRWRADSAWRTLSLIPFAEALLLFLFARSYFPGLASKPPDIVGLPFGLVVDAVILGWAALGARVIWTTRSQVMASIALLTTTAPAVPILLLLPAIAVIVQNMA